MGAAVCYYCITYHMYMPSCYTFMPAIADGRTDATDLAIDGTASLTIALAVA